MVFPSIVNHFIQLSCLGRPWEPLIFAWSTESQEALVIGVWRRVKTWGDQALYLWHLFSVWGIGGWVKGVVETQLESLRSSWCEERWVSQVDKNGSSHSIVLSCIISPFLGPRPFPQSFLPFLNHQPRNSPNGQQNLCQFISKEGQPSTQEDQSAMSSRVNVV